jgi:hypothetical protein
MIGSISASLLFCSCDEKSSESSSDSDETPEEVEALGTLAVEAKATEVIKVTEVALASVSEGESFGTLSTESLSPRALAVTVGDMNPQTFQKNNDDSMNLVDGDGDGDQGNGSDSNGDNNNDSDGDDDGPSEINKNCGGNGQPYGADGKELRPGDEGFMIKSFYCLLHDKESPDVVLGNIGIMRGFVCLAESVEGFEYVEGGKTVDLKLENILATEVAKTCFPKEVISNSEEDQDTSDGEGAFEAKVTGHLLPEGPWSHKITILATKEPGDGDDFEGPVDTYFMVNEDKAAFKRQDNSASIDFKNGILRFENIEKDHNRHTRLLVKGTVGTDGAVSNVTYIEGIQFTGHGVITVKGDQESGFTYNHFGYRCEDCQADPQSKPTKYLGGEWDYYGSECLGSTTCAKENGLVFSVDTDAEFRSTEVPGQIEKIEAWEVSHGPLCFDAVGTTLLPDDTCSLVEAAAE